MPSACPPPHPARTLGCPRPLSSSPAQRVLQTPLPFLSLKLSRCGVAGSPCTRHSRTHACVSLAGWLVLTCLRSVRSRDQHLCPWMSPGQGSRQARPALHRSPAGGSLSGVSQGTEGRGLVPPSLGRVNQSGGRRGLPLGNSDNQGSAETSGFIIERQFPAGLSGFCFLCNKAEVLTAFVSESLCSPMSRMFP